MTETPAGAARAALAELVGRVIVDLERSARYTISAREGGEGTK